MLEALLVISIVLSVAVIGLQLFQLSRKVQVDLSPIRSALEEVGRAHERTERSVSDEFAKNRVEQAGAARQSREEINTTLKGVGDSLDKQLLALTTANDQRLGAMRDTIEKRLDAVQEESTKKLDQIRQESATSAQKTRDDVNKSVNEFMAWQRVQFGTNTEQIKGLTEANDKRLVELRETLETKLKSMQDDNAKNLEQMRQTVDEKLEGTLERRLGESFKLVSERLEQVHNGLGEMQALATGVGDLKRVLTNVKARGTWGEVQLDRMLEDVLTPEQYGKNVATNDGNESVEFAIKLPGRGDDPDDVVWLPIDAKFPMEDYQRLVEAQECGDVEAADMAVKQLEARIKGCAGDIFTKYVNPPKTTDFGILFLPTEGLFAEVVRRPGLTETIQRLHHVVIAGPTTLWSILNSLQMGFRTLAIQQRSSEVWNLLAAVKTEFGKYGQVMSKVQKKLQEATNTVDQVATRTRAIERKLKTVQELPAPEGQDVWFEAIEVDADGDGAAE